MDELHPFFRTFNFPHRTEPVPEIVPLGGASPFLHRLLQLKQLSYEPQALLQRTRELFGHDIPNDVLQTSAKHHFGTIFLASRDNAPFSEADLRMYMMLFDVYFFAGNLTGTPEPMITLEFRDDIFDQWNRYVFGNDVLWGRTTPQYSAIGTPQMTAKVKIELEARQPQGWGGQRAGRRDLVRVLKTLLHEMAHAYLILFACPCNNCRNQIGATGHGRVWQELMRSTFAEVASWHESLGEFHTEDVHNLD